LNEGSISIIPVMTAKVRRTQHRRAKDSPLPLGSGRALAGFRLAAVARSLLV
jgi:hypothetical protein